MRFGRLAALPLSWLLAACAAAPSVPQPVSAPPGAATVPSATVPPAVAPPPADPTPPLAERPPADRLVAFDSASLSDDGQVLTLRFTGGKAFVPGDPCTNAYAGWAGVEDGILRAAVVDVTPDLPRGAGGCDAVGHGRVLAVDLPEPYTGERLDDLAGDVHFLRAPAGLAEIRGLEAGWDLLWEGDVPGSRAGRWQRTWTPRQELPAQSGPGRIDLYQAFGGPVEVTGGDGVGEPVTVNGMPARLYRWPPAGELVLVWSIGGTELALVANQGDFSEPDVIRLAESVVLPGSS